MRKYTIPFVCAALCFIGALLLRPITPLTTGYATNTGVVVHTAAPSVTDGIVRAFIYGAIGWGIGLILQFMVRLIGRLNNSSA